MKTQSKPEKRFISLKEVNKRISPFRLTSANIAKMKFANVATVYDKEKEKYYFDWYVVRDELNIKVTELNEQGRP